MCAVKNLVCPLGYDCGGYKDKSCKYKHYPKQGDGSSVPKGRVAVSAAIKKQIKNGTYGKKKEAPGTSSGGEP